MCRANVSFSNVKLGDIWLGERGLARVAQGFAVRTESPVIRLWLYVSIVTIETSFCYRVVLRWMRE